jgi:N-carbamoylputrescine amidase
MKIALIQTRVSDRLEENLDKTARFIKQAAKKGAEVVCLQELFAHRYFAQTKDEKFFEIAETVPETFPPIWPAAPLRIR